MWMLGLNSGPLQEQMLLTTEQISSPLLAILNFLFLTRVCEFRPAKVNETLS